MPTNPNNAAQGGLPEPLRDTEKTGVIGNMGQSTKSYDTHPSNSSNPGIDPSSGVQPTQKQQGADRPKDAPTDDENTAVQGKKDEAEASIFKRDPNDRSGEPMRMHDGGLPSTQEERRTSKVGNPGGQEHGKEEKGTGEQWVKTSGLAADGGDFDATKPGAGREADSKLMTTMHKMLQKADSIAGLLEEKGIKKGDAGQQLSSESESQVESAGKKEKVPLGEKIKTKLHLGHKEK